MSAQQVWAEMSRVSRALWAKSGDETGWLDLPQHLQDSAGVATHLWDTWLSEATRSFLCVQLGLDDAGARSVVAWCAGTHDLGKASQSFAGQLEGRPGAGDFADRIRAAGLEIPRFLAPQDRVPHAQLSQVILEDWLVETLGVQRRKAMSLACVAGAHHGVPLPATEHLRAQSNARSHSEPWLEVRAELLQAVTASTEAQQALNRVLECGVPVAAQMVLTAIVIVSDWIASNADLFPMQMDPSPGRRESRGVDDLHLTQPWRAAPPAAEGADAMYRQRFEWPEDATARPMQRVAVEAARALGGPGLICIEAPMGQGKTEAALLAAEVLAASTGKGGMIFAAPTMATSDALFTRVAHWASGAVGDGAIASMYLGHSKNTLNESFAAMPHDRGVRGLAEEAGSVVAHQWLYGRKKGMLSTFVVATVDQVLFLALQSKHVMLRHLGIGDKVVVIDEVHAYDLYMTSYLERALEWLGAYGAPVILLSATLPERTRDRLVGAYRRGRGVAEPRRRRRSAPAPQRAVEPDLTYPLITTASREAVRRWEAPGSVSGRTVSVEEIGDGDSCVLTALASVVEEGGCALVLCNTVERAQRIYERVRVVAGDDVVLVHARFIAADRVTAESHLVAELGPTARRGRGRPERRIVVATQVVEQSLDLDFDLMITDFAPTDLLLQRMGRLHRHDRPDEDRPATLRVPRLLLRGLEATGDQVHAPVFSREYTKIYEDSILLASYAQLLPHLQGRPVALPGDISALVQHTYRTDPQVPETWEERFTAATEATAARREDQAQRAATFRLPAPSAAATLTDLFQDQTADIARDTLSEVRGAAQVRDTDPTLEVLLVQRVHGGLRPLPWLTPQDWDVLLVEDRCPDADVALTLATSSVRLPYYYSAPDTFDAALSQLAGTSPAAWQDSPYLRGQLLLVLDAALEATLAGKRLRYSRQLGLQMLRTPRSTPIAQESP